MDGAQVEAKINMLEAQLNEAVKRKEDLASQKRDCEVKLERADKLIGGLGGERVRWVETIGDLASNIRHIVGDVMIAAGAIAYNGPFTPPFRQRLNAEWLKMIADLQVPTMEYHIKVLCFHMLTNGTHQSK